ncbi:hypothetical protein VCHA54P489_360016 [Vibrio chagasii]|nr:hypothetical protein VCHA28O22_250002 [Vibrio chagasii]CAH7155939.1 hypothetical protein VCHA43P282_270012 [Vibrio chagasii]CAH7168868.1 hypothetical protein VCHA50O393_270007 [Vibrio chagasii]CAH7200048.1 hypothetical protein VCHA38P215_340022 [Vibrio chagasii]CAH7200204.1 hypothetical protein VCHA43P275_310028 [Vibrio chagasii]
MCTTLSIFLSSEFITESLFVSKSINLDLACPRLDTMTLSLTISFTKPKKLSSTHLFYIAGDHPQRSG